MLDAGLLLALALLGGVVALDGTSLGQFMISRPFAAATLAGWVAGSPMHGVAVGLVLEAFHLAVLPVGAAKYPEGGPPAVAAGAVYASSDLTASTLLIILIGALLLERAGGETVRVLRQLNVRLTGTGSARVPSAAALERRHLTALAVDLVRGVVLTLVTIALLSAASRLSPYWGLPQRTAEILILAAVAGMLVSAFRLVGSHVWFAAAGAVAAVVGLLLTV